MKILTVVGARPQFVKASAVSRLLRESHSEVLLHTGQHYDERMSKVFFSELDIPEPDYNLEVGSAGHSVQTGEMLIRMEPILENEKPDCVLVYGDTNSTLAGALVSAKLNIPVAHVEAGLRSFNRAMPEEINRVLTDHVSQFLFCPAQAAVENLTKEGIINGVYVVGDVMYDAILKYGAVAEAKSNILSSLNLKPSKYLLVTVHRQSNVDDPNRIPAILETLSQLGETVVFPAHPRAMRMIESLGLRVGENVKIVEPVGYLDMLRLERNARIILTDSGGVQKEAYWMGVPCVTLREETEWVETVQTGWNVVAGVDGERIINAVHDFPVPASRPNLFGDGNAGRKILQHLETELG
jgi:UDP-GlcNAc3NAcA epimerase